MKFSTQDLASGVPSFPFVCPSNSSFDSGTFKEIIAVKPSLTSSPAKFASFSFKRLFFLA